MQAFLNVPSLRLMYLGSNRITQLEPFQFRHFETLEMLDLTENQLAIIPENAFSGMPRLSQLYLGQNIIEQIDSQAFLNNRLEILLLPNNRLVRVDENLFKGMGFLQQLSLKNNMVRLCCNRMHTLRSQIVSIAQNAFYEAPALVMLDMSHNRLTGKTRLECVSHQLLQNFRRPHSSHNSTCSSSTCHTINSHARHTTRSINVS
jgi:Leucine-rich repeat (LRR) protein